MMMIPRPFSRKVLAYICHVTEFQHPLQRKLRVLFLFPPALSSILLSAFGTKPQTIVAYPVHEHRFEVTNLVQNERHCMHLKCLQMITHSCT